MFNFFRLVSKTARIVWLVVFNMLLQLVAGVDRPLDVVLLLVWISL